jgi:YbbR domain-containing protein
MNDWPAKMFSLAAAFLLFVFFSLNRLNDRYMSVPLAISLNETYLPSNQIPRSVRVTLHGEAESLVAIREEDITASLDLTPFRNEGIHRVNVRIEKRGDAAALDPLEIKVEPSEIAVGIEKKARKTVPVTPSFRGFLEPGYELTSYSLSPPQIEISGPAGAIARTTDIPTDFIELAGRNGDFSARVNLLKKELLNVVNGQDSAEFRAVIQKSMPARIVSNLEIQVSGLPEQFVLSEAPPLGSIRLKTSRGGAEASQNPGFGLAVDASDIRKAGTYSLPVVARSPEGIAVESYEPATVSLHVAQKKEVLP